MKEEYLSVKDFSELAGVTKSALYQQMQTRLKPYTISTEGVKLIKREALKLYGKEGAAHDGRASEPPESETEARYILREKDKHIEILERELSERNKQIEAQAALIENLRRDGSENTARFGELLKSNQVIIAGLQARVLQLEAPAEEDKPEPMQEERKSILQRIFG